MNYIELATKINERKAITPGHRTCPGCPIAIILRTAYAATDKKIVTSSATSCAEVTTTIYPYTSWNEPFIHSVFANAAATISGVETAYRVLKKKGKIKEEIKFMAFAGDGGAFDIGLQSLSGALERGHDFVFVCYDNEGYQNTNNQKSSATPFGAETTTTPGGKTTFQKDLAKIAIAHKIPYVATANPGNLLDMHAKFKKAFEKKGPAVIIVYAACPTNMKAPEELTVDISKLATDTNFWPLYEVEDGKYRVSYKPANKKPIEEFLKMQTKFREFLKDKENIKAVQNKIDKEWEELLKMEEAFPLLKE